MKRIVYIAAVSILALSVNGFAAQRSAKAVRDFRRANPCPATGKTKGACPGWVIDHIEPLCFGGADDPANMTWQDKGVSLIKDRFEREACRLKKACAVKP